MQKNWDDRAIVSDKCEAVFGRCGKDKGLIGKGVMQKLRPML